MANCCLSHKNYQTLKKIFENKPPSLFWSDEIRPLLKELERQLDGSIITESKKYGHSISIKWDHKSSKDIDLCRDESIQCTCILTVLKDAGVNLEPPLTKRRQRFLFSRWCSTNDNEPNLP